MPDNKSRPAKRLCFVIGPIGPAGSDIRKHADMILHAVLKDVLEKEEFNYEVKRADKDPRPGMINDRVINDIINADLVIADLTDLNPNAFYELGIRHLSEKSTIHIARDGTNLPFDNLGHDTIFVDVADWNSIESARSRLRESVLATQSADYVVSNPITQAKATIKLKDSADPKDKIIAEMRDRLGDIEKMVSDGASSNHRMQRNSPLLLNLDSGEAKSIHDFNLTISMATKKGLNNEQMLENISRVSYEKGLHVQVIGMTSSEIIYDVGPLRVTMRRDGTGWSHASI